MHFTNIAFTLGAILALVTIASATFNQERARRLAAVGGDFSLLKDNPRNQRIFDRAVRKLRRKFPNCTPNVCFAIDGSGSISDREYSLQKEFVALAIAVLGPLEGSKFAVAEYGGIVDAIVQLQEASEDILFDVVADEQTKSTISFVAPGIQWCSTQFDRMPAAVNKIILLGDGGTNFLDTGRFGAVRVAARFEDKSVGNAICAGIVGRGNRAFFRRIVRGVNEKLVSPRNWDRILAITGDLVEQICG